MGDGMNMSEVIVTERAHANRMVRLQSLPIWITAPIYIAAYVTLNWLAYVGSSTPFGIEPWDPNTGLTVAAILIFGERFWPYVIMAVAAADILLHGNQFPLACHVIAPFIAGGGYVLAFGLVQRSKWQFDIRLRTLRDVLVLESTAIVSSLLIAFCYITLLTSFGAAHSDDFGYNLLRSAFGDLIGISIVTPFLLMLASSGGLRRLTPEAALQGIAIGAALVFAFGFSTLPHFRLFNVIFFPIIWIALRSGLEGASYGLIVTQIGLTLALAISGPQAAGVMTYQALMLVVAFTGLAIGGLVTERRRFEQELRLNQESVAQIFRVGSVGELATTIAHEINQPLTAISNYTRLIQDYLENGEGDKKVAAEAATKVVTQVDRTAAVVKNLRDLIRLGRRQIAQQNVHVLVREALDLLDPNLQRAAITAKVAIARDIREALVDRLQIEQVLTNILSNAIDAINESNPPERLIAITAKNLDAQQIEIAIRDTGPGFPPDFDLKHPGIRSSDKKDGLGVGLSLSRTIVQGHGGDLVLDGGNTGAIVRIRLKSLPREIVR